MATLMIKLPPEGIAFCALPLSSSQPGCFIISGMRNAKSKMLPIAARLELKRLLPFLLLGLTTSMPLMAKDVAMEQYNFSAAQKDYDEAKSDVEAATQTVKAQEKRVAQEQARLKEQQQKLSEAKAHLVKAKAQLDKQQKALDRAWDESGS